MGGLSFKCFQIMLHIDVRLLTVGLFISKELCPPPPVTLQPPQPCIGPFSSLLEETVSGVA